jgi:adenosylcobinamide kinase/adenosylcobinamide-phosphate guanylyltransferase
MEVVLLGTGAADGWPNPFCDCPSCAEELAAGRVRGQSAALVDGTLLLDCGPEVPRAAARLGRSLSGVRHLLLTHSHPDHTGPLAALFRSWAGRSEPLDLIGPQQALDAFADWVGPHDPVRCRPVTAGDVVDLDGYSVRALAASHGDAMTGPGLLYDVTGPDGHRLLYATDTGPLLAATVDAVRGRAFDLVLLEETFGDRLDHGTDHLDLGTFPVAAEALRTAGAITTETDLVAVHLGHHNPATPILAQRLAEAGARVEPDGAVLTTRTSRGRHRVLVIGGARSGKSRYAERLLAVRPAVTYVATGDRRPDDPEWEARVDEHRARRPSTWLTVETLDVEEVLRGAAPGDSVLVDCVALWLTRVMDASGSWESGTGPADAAASERLAERCRSLVDAVRTSPADVVLVSNEVGSGVVPATSSGRLFRDELGRLNTSLAAVADETVLVVAGLPLRLSGPDPERGAP